MSLSSNWTTEKYGANESSMFNEGVMCMFETSFDGLVNRCIAISAKQDGRKAALLFNNRLYLSIAVPSAKNKLQYEANRFYILSHYSR